MILRLLAVALVAVSGVFLFSIAGRLDLHLPHGSFAEVLRNAKVALSEEEGNTFMGAALEEGWFLEDAPARAAKPAAKPAARVAEPAREAAKPARPTPPHGDCLSSLAALSPDDAAPAKGARHMVTPPASRTVLVCCATTKGALTIAVRPGWAPLGAQRFLDMVESGYFSSQVPLFRCMKGFLCQFGLSGDARLSKRWPSFKDDPSWLPLGPEHRRNAEGVPRFARGYLAYAGAGPQSRSNQLIVSLIAEERLCGGSPWEVPWGELVGEKSLETLSSIFTGYGDNGPNQGLLMRSGVDEAFREKWPDLDYITDCAVVDNSTAR